MTTEGLRKDILDLVGRYAAAAQGNRAKQAAIQVPPSGRVYGAAEMQALVDSSLDFWLTTGRYNDQFETRLASFLGLRHALTTNSGSSANLLAVSALTSHLLKDKALKAGDEVITAAAAFPTTVNPLLLYGMVPVFVDVEIPTYNVPLRAIEAAITPKTRAIVLAHTLGNPFAVGEVARLAKDKGLWLIEDCCDALGSTHEGKLVGRFGDIGTLSFYPAHHITMGEGGAVFTDSALLRRILRSVRDWGRDCYCDPGVDNTCGKRFDWKLGELPHGYDHKYIYSHLGYNLKITDMQAAVGCAQLNRAEEFIAKRRSNYAYLRSKFERLEEHFILPEATPGSDPAWFGFPVTLRHGDRVDRGRFLKYLDSRGIGTRLLFGGNLTRQPYFRDRNYRVSQSLQVTDRVMRDSFWLGVYPAITQEMMDHVVASIEDWLKENR